MLGADLLSVDAAGALEVAQRLEQRVRDEGIAHGDSTVGPIVTVSLGVATREAYGNEPLGDLLAGADRQLYRAKELGRGRACAAPAALAD